jgi:hypothetical protein
VNLKNYLRCQWDRAGAVVCLTAGFVALIVGYLGVSGTRETADQIPYVVSGGMLGLFLLGGGVMLWLSADMRDEWRKLDSIDARLAGDAPDTPLPQSRAAQPRQSVTVP